MTHETKIILGSTIATILTTAIGLAVLITTLFLNLGARIDTVEGRLENRIDTVESRLNSGIDTFESHIARTIRGDRDSAPGRRRRNRTRSRTTGNDQWAAIGTFSTARGRWLSAEWT